MVQSDYSTEGKSSGGGASLIPALIIPHLPLSHKEKEYPMPFIRRAATPVDPNAPPPLFDGPNLVCALVTATLSGGALAATLYAPRWPIPCAIIALVIVAFASQMNISLVNPGVIVPRVTLVSQERMTATGVAPAPDTTITTHAAQTTVVVDPPAVVTPRPEQSSDHVAATVQRNAAGQYARRVIPPAPPVA
jgi:hypothetical protein